MVLVLMDAFRNSGVDVNELGYHKILVIIKISVAYLVSTIPYYFSFYKCKFTYFFFNY
jgi:hypothetical protein